MKMDRELPDVLGAGRLMSKHSAVDVEGHLRAPGVAGVQFRPTRPVPHEDGHVTEVARASWAELVNPIVQVHITTTLAGRVRAWGLHPRGTDRLFVVSGLVKLVVFDGRNDSPTLGRWSEFVVSEKEPGPPDRAAQPLPRLEEHRERRGGHHQHARPDVRLRAAGRARPAVGFAGRARDHSLRVVSGHASSGTTSMSTSARPARFCIGSRHSRPHRGRWKPTTMPSSAGPSIGATAKHRRAVRGVLDRVRRIASVDVERQRRSEVRLRESQHADAQRESPGDARVDEVARVRIGSGPAIRAEHRVALGRVPVEPRRRVVHAEATWRVDERRLRRAQPLVARLRR
jgi:hypothetical protein